ncbi:MAG: cysteine hydrolase [Hyphomicrobiales bacterium]|nr:cysteine hydrolase [Hyphomicrobiales bacterium]
MTAPQTLLALSGADTTPGRLSRAAVVLIDCQMEYLDGALPLAGIDGALAEVGRLLARARNAGAPVIHVAHRGGAGGPFDRAAPRGQLAPAAAAADGEPVVEKGLPNAFAGTNLAGVLEGTGRREIVVAGFMTHMCVSSTVRAALDLGYRTTVVAGATATRDLPDGNGGVVAAADLQRASLAALADRFAVIAATAADLPD